MSEIILINPAISRQRIGYTKLEDVRIREPPGILALGTYLHENGISVKILDVVPYHEVGDESYLTILEKELDNAICVGISVMTAQISNALLISQFIKNKFPNLPIIWGGVHPTLFPAQTSKDPLIDFVVYGEGEATTLELLNELEKKSPKFEAIKGIAFDGFVTQPREFMDINKLPFLNHDLLDLKFYLVRPVPIIYSDTKKIRKLTMLSSRGCPYRCTFCINKLTKSSWRAQNADRFLDEFEFIVNKYKLDMVKPLDENFFVSKKRAEEIIRKMKERKIDVKWGTNIRANYFRENYVTTNFAKELKSVGFEFASMGAESGSDAVLKHLKKDITTKDLLNSAKVCSESGIIPLYSWMIALPGETIEEMKSNIRIMKQINKICPSARHYDNFIFRPYPGGELYEQCKELGLNEPASLREWADADASTGYKSLDDLPWVENPEFVRFLSENSKYIVYNLKTLKKITESNISTAYSIIPKLRWIFSLFKYQEEEQKIKNVFMRFLK